ncbi:MAG: FAD-dependent monooxygenase [Acetobacteraceae bacterium]
MAQSPVLVVGAGPTGLMLALCLVRRGVPVRIVDQASGPGQASRAMAVHARTLELYQQLGFAHEVVARGIKVERPHLRAGGTEVARFDFGDLGAGLSPFPFILTFPQDDHERLLGEQLAAAGVRVEWGTALRDVSQDDAGVRAILDRDGAAETVETPYLGGCDGAHSRVREALGLRFVGGTYDQPFFVADVAAEGVGAAELVVSLGADSLVLLLPVRSSGSYRLIGLVPPALAGRHDLTFADVRAGAEQLLGIRIGAVNWFSTYRVHRRVADRFQVGRCFIAGDAGHVHSPAGGQGMNTGIGDAANLGWKLAHVVLGRADPAILDTYETERIAFARQLVATTDRAFAGIVGRGLSNQVLRTVLMPHVFPVLTGFAAVRRAMFRAVSQIRITYRGSALSAGAAGAVQGGDRLPWLAEADNFTPLRSLDWQLHVYGSVRPALRAAASAMGCALHEFAVNAAGLRRDAAYLVRPDGYVGLALPDQDPAALQRYAARLGLRLGSG